MARTRRDATAWGVVKEYTDAAGEHRRLSRATVDLLLDALGADSVRPAADRGPLVVTAGRAVDLGGLSEVVLEDGTRLPGSTTLARGTPPGYHRMEPVDDRRRARTLIVTPPRCPLPDRRRAGVAVQLYAARSTGSWGIGDLAGAARLGEWARGHGADFLLLNPLHAPAPTLPQQPSPYSPASRRYRSPLLLNVAAIPGADGLGPELEPLAAAGRALNASRRIDRDAVWRLLLPALERIHQATADADRTELDAFVLREGEPLRRFALWSALAERHGASFREWPRALRAPGPRALDRLTAEHAARVRFHAWVQLQLDRQLAAAARSIDLVNDLAVGVDPNGADAWADQSSLAAGMHVGAPPDLYNPTGQDWGLPPYDPWRLRDADYAPLVQTIRAGLRHAAGLRVDHVMGLVRLWWVPTGLGAAAGGYIRYASDELLGILALEATRAGAFVVGEDLGTVDAEIHDALLRRAVLSYKVLWFETAAPARYARRALAAATTHDLPTIAGLWSGADLAAQGSLGRDAVQDQASARWLRRALLRLPGVTPRSSVPAVVDAVHTALGRSPSLLAVATIDDLLHVEERPNHPGTIDEWPNWRLALPRTVEEVTADPAAARRLRRLRRR